MDHLNGFGGRQGATDNGTEPSAQASLLDCRDGHESPYGLTHGDGAHIHQKKHYATKLAQYQAALSFDAVTNSDFESIAKSLAGAHWLRANSYYFYSF